MQIEDGDLGFYECLGGGLMARRAVQTLAAELAQEGVSFLKGRVEPIRASDGKAGALPFVATSDNQRILAEQFVFACGPWLDKACPEAMADRLFVTRQEVFYFATRPSDVGTLPVWADLPFYGLPSLEGRGFKVANDTHGAWVDPDTQGRRASEEGEDVARGFLARSPRSRLPNPESASTRIALTATSSSIVTRASITCGSPVVAPVTASSTVRRSVPTWPV